jgi:hypothetical protein
MISYDWERIKEYACVILFTRKLVEDREVKFIKLRFQED